MKRSPDEQRVLERMSPGVFSGDGFLGTDTRPLGEIIDTDRSTLVGLGTTPGELAAQLARVFDAAKARLGNLATTDGHLHAVHHEGMGRIPCPWGGCGTFQKGEVELTDDRTGQTLVFTTLSIHLVAAHGFFQGRGSRYRLGPDVLHRIFHEAGADPQRRP